MGGEPTTLMVSFERATDGSSSAQLPFLPNFSALAANRAANGFLHQQVP